MRAVIDIIVRLERMKVLVIGEACWQFMLFIRLGNEMIGNGFVSHDYV